MKALNKLFTISGYFHQLKFKVNKANIYLFKDNAVFAITYYLNEEQARTFQFN